jgi:hypothetical protein
MRPGMHRADDHEEGGSGEITDSVQKRARFGRKRAEVVINDVIS